MALPSPTKHGASLLRDPQRRGSPGVGGGAAMICPGCHGRGVIRRLDPDRPPLPCSDCGGQGAIACCDRPTGPAAEARRFYEADTQTGQDHARQQQWWTRPSERTR
jgi:hypothetical protein